MTVAREGFPFIFGTLIPGGLLAGLYSTHQSDLMFGVGILLILLGLFCIAFFRNPDRDIPTDLDLLLSPADGKVIRINRVEDDYVGKSIKVDIFLSVFDVHLNRIPISGQVDFVRYRPGKFISAFKDKASTDNERTDVGISGSWCKVRVTQIAGLIARRIVCRANENDAVQLGQLYGLIRFGSRTELTFPDNCEVCVKVGDRVKGGETILGRRINDA